MIIIWQNGFFKPGFHDVIVGQLTYRIDWCFRGTTNEVVSDAQGLLLMGIGS